AAGGSRKLIEMGLTLPLYGQEGRIEDCVREVLASDSLRGLLRYSNSRGMGEHREVGSIWINRHGLETTADDILVTAGSTNALTCCFVAFLRPGDCMAVDALTYPGIISLASTMGIRLKAIEMDEFGMLPEALESECAKTPIRALYLMPNAQNPTSRMMSAQRRDQIAKVIERRALLLFEDDAYGDASEQHPVALSARIPASSVFIAGLSKFLGAGLRISFVAAKGRMCERLESAILSTVWMASPINAQIVATIIKSGVAEKLLRKKRKEARKRVALATEILAGYRFNCQETGLFGWLELPEGRSGKEFELAAREEDLRVFCAERFSAGGPVPQAVRLSLSGPKDIDELRQALQILSGLLSKRPSAWETLL
ncbi:MAG: PLP-dependent aminotransferase family protein, partial [Spirochaetota bacterium]